MTQTSDICRLNKSENEYLRMFLDFMRLNSELVLSKPGSGNPKNQKLLRSWPDQIYRNRNL